MMVQSKWTASVCQIFAFFPCSVLGSDGSSLPSWASSQSTWGALRQSLKSLSVEFAVLSDKAAQQVKPPTPPSVHLLCCNELNDKNECFGNVLRGDGKRTMSWKSSISFWICCSRIEWVFCLNGIYCYDCSGLKKRNPHFPAIMWSLALCFFPVGPLRASREGCTPRAPESPAQVQCDEEADDECHGAAQRAGVSGAAGVSHCSGGFTPRNDTLIII